MLELCLGQVCFALLGQCCLPYNILYNLTQYEGVLPFSGYVRQWHGGIVQ